MKLLIFTMVLYHMKVKSLTIQWQCLTKALLLKNPLDRIITNEARNFNIEYAEAEWQWYLSGEPTIDTLGSIYGKIPQIWQKMADENGKVNSNYGAQWERGWQLDKVVAMLKK